MSDSSRTFREDTKPKLAGIDPADIANAQFDQPLAHQVGEGMAAVVWISPIYDALAISETTTVGKK